MATTTKKEKKSFGTTMGVTSIIAILVILILIVFSALSITTSKADLALSEKTAVATAAFYKADTEAEVMFGDIYKAVKAGGDWATPVKALGCEVTPTEGGQSVLYYVDIDDNKALKVELIIPPTGEIIRKEWRIAPTTEWEPDNDLNVITEFPLS